MAQQLTTTYRTAMAQPVRMPRVTVTAYPNGTPRDLSADVIACVSERTWEHRAGTATLTLANPYGRYDPGGYLDQGAYLKPGTLVRVCHGLATTAGMETLPVFTGIVEALEAPYRRGEPETVTVRLLDLAGRYLRQECTSRLFENATLLEILAELFCTVGELPEAQFGPVATPRAFTAVQFVEEAIMDLGVQLLQAQGKRLFFDAQGVLRSGPLAPASQPDWPNDEVALLAITERWEMPTASQVVVTGALQAPTCQIGALVMWQEVTVSNYNYGTTVEVPFHPGDAKYTEISVSPVTPLAPTEQVVLYSVNGNSITVKVVSPGGRTIAFRCFGRQVFYTTPHIATTQTDGNLLLLCGHGRRLEVTNPYVDTQADAVSLATTLLAHLWASRHRITVRLRANPAIEPGDVVAVVNPRTQAPAWIHAMTVSHAWRRGVEEVTTVDGVAVTP
jgi:hypothetical protein